MERLERDSVLLDLLRQLGAQGSWCGETHMQKATFFLQDLMQVPLGFDFILYKHGPFSFDLRDELTAMRADGLLKLQSQEPYGPSLMPGPSAQEIEKRHKSTIDKFRKQIAFVAKSLGKRQVADLERIATAQYIISHYPGMADPAAVAKQINDLKPHISTELAVEAASEARHISEKAAAIR